ncbi:YicC family protein [Thiomicrospira microaerophila]|uniref:YicC/YloC family endoribonuclease n=1 Tax=Thiomicrospira microaerophila TaxID=406020 RepID=UPI00200E9906|nr:YicC/YloC family endoribonuclease [Thiomicrospira microaerophila]UQB42363.1 YicC family protein [Thiomicrospira microaerophila]
MKSMTASAHLSHNFDAGQIHWDIRAVNQRFLELNFRLPEAARALEMPLREACKKSLQRGKLDIGLRYELHQNEQGYVIDNLQLQQLSQAINQIQLALPEATQINPLDLLNWPGLLANPQANLTDYQTEILTSFHQALEQLNQVREREGAQLAEMLNQRCQAIRQQLAELKPLMPEILAIQQAKLTARIAEMTASLDESRLATELAMLAQKTDITEEIDRLYTHLDEVERVIQQTGAIGRRLDFLMQELNREANTLGSKSIDIRTTQTSVELKVLIEQMREQVQNIE